MCRYVLELVARCFMEHCLNTSVSKRWWRWRKNCGLRLGVCVFLFRSCQGGIGLVESKSAAEARAERDEFRRKLKEEWTLVWRERFDDRLKAEGVAVRDYPMLFMDRGVVVFASRDAKPPCFSEIVAAWASQGRLYCPDSSVGGWGKFIRTEMRKVSSSRARAYRESPPKLAGGKVQQKKGGRGWLHLE
jgi:hypothetical protein